MFPARTQMRGGLRQKSHDENGSRDQQQDDDLPTRLPMHNFQARRYNKLGYPCFTRSFDAERAGPINDLQNPATPESRWSNLVLHHSAGRRPSFLYRLESDDVHSLYSSRHTSITGEDLSDFQNRTPSQTHVDEPIVTPFAQILASLRRVRANFILLTNVSSSRDSRFGTTHSSLTEDQQTLCPSGAHEQFKSTATETLEELEWCLERLENIQTHRSVSDMASSKFKKLLNKELSQFTDGSRTGKQISEYICSTYLDSKEGDTNAIGTGPSEADESVNLTKSSPGVLGENVSAVSQTCPPDSLAIKSRINAHSSTAEVCTGIEPAKSALGTPNSALISSPDSTTSLPERLLPFGVESEHPQLLNKIITESLDVWGLDVFELGEMTLNPLTCVFYAVMQKRGLIKRFAIPEMNLIRYVNALESKYNVNPYHNRLHATDVLQSTHVLLNAQALSPLFTDLEVLSLLFACAIHDVDHPGLTNQYLINTNDKLAILYNDASVLENHHLAVAFSLLSQPGCDIFENLQKKQRLSLRRMTIDMVLATDMSKHMSILADLKTMVETKKVAGSGVLTLDNYSDRMQILKSMIHCSDLSNPAKPLELYRRWNARIMEENFRQGDREREQGLELSPMCDRTTASIEKSQVSFIDYIAHPLWETWADLVYPDAQKILDTIDENREWYLGQIVEEGRKASTAD
ncbi:unnamed protein product [Calicophoron daubneyi]|uniref:Phosphodiesterase n=1 Tax=Calicophoron daubneyi TaxID=300641 RepID=A0AAV2TH07_CALDB